MGNVAERPTARALFDVTRRAFIGLWTALSSAHQSPAIESKFEAVAARLVLSLAEVYAGESGLPREALLKSQLAVLAEPVAKLTPIELCAYVSAYEQQLEGLLVGPQESSARRLFIADIAAVYESLLALPGGLDLAGNGSKRTKKQSGSFYTPAALARQVVALALAHPAGQEPARVTELRVLDPAVGAGVFLIEACHWLATKLVAESPGLKQQEALSLVARTCLYGVDVNRLSVAVSEVCLWLTVADQYAAPGDFSTHLMHGDALVGYGLEGAAARELTRSRLETLESHVSVRAFDFQAAFPDLGEGFDVVIGNPPWVAYAGRAAQPLARQLRSYFSESYAAWKGFPTLHALFVERAALLAPRGSVALLLPSPLADLDGYRSVRAKLTTTHRVREGLPEFGQDAFSGVTQPCFALVADQARDSVSSPAPWKLRERQRASGASVELEVPAVLQLLDKAKPLAAIHFGEMGFQTSRVASETLLLRAEVPDDLHQLPLLEGRNVSEFFEGPARLFLRADAALLSQARCRLRGQQDYQRVDFVVRQTAPVPIAALHGGLAFRNSLLGGFASAELSAALLVALLNSSLYRALHLARQRDARQAAFPQVKIGHLRSLPQPPCNARVWAALEQLTLAATQRGVSDESRATLDALTFELFAIPTDHQAAVLAFLSAGAPRFASKVARVTQTRSASLESLRGLLGISA